MASSDLLSIDRADAPLLELNAPADPRAVFVQLVVASEQLPVGGVLRILGDCLGGAANGAGLHQGLPPHYLAQAERAGFEPIADAASGHLPHDRPLLQSFRRLRIPRWQVRPLGAADAPAMAKLFEAVFGAPMSPLFWRWKYGDGRGVAVGVWNADGQLVAHVGGIYRTLSWFGASRRGIQCCDVAVAVGDRGSLSRQGPFFMAMATFLELEIGDTAPAYAGFGFPNRRAYVLPEKLGLYRHCGRVFEARWPTVQRPPFWATRVSELEPGASPAVDRLFDQAWAAMAHSLKDCVVGERDAAYLRHRFCDHPDHVYRLLAVRHRLGGGLLGIAILRHGVGSEADCEMLDLIGARRAMPALLAQARRFAARLGARSLFAWLSEKALTHLRTADMETRDIEVVIPANRWTAAQGTESANGHWWLTGGDTDFR